MSGVWHPPLNFFPIIQMLPTSTCNEETNLSLAVDSFRTRRGAYQSFPDYFGKNRFTVMYCVYISYRGQIHCVLILRFVKQTLKCNT